MAQMTAPEKNALRKAIRLLEMRENQGDPTYDATCDEIAAQMRAMLLPTEKFNVILPEDCPFTIKVVYYEIDGDLKHLFCSYKPNKKKGKKESMNTDEEPTNG